MAGSLLVLSPAPSRAGTIAQPRLALHLLSVTSKNACVRVGATPACNDIVNRGGLYPDLYYAYLLVTHGDAASGVAGLQCGLEYKGAAQQGVDVFGWGLCADLNFPTGGWPAAGQANTITWDYTTRCQRSEPGGPGTGVVATAGYFYLAAYSADVLQLTVRPVDQLAAVVDCSVFVSDLEGRDTHHEPSLLGSVAFSAGAASPGHTPCADAAQPIPYALSGPEEVDEGTSTTSTASEAPFGTAFAWTVTGQAAFVGSTTNASVIVQAGGLFPTPYYTYLIAGAGLPPNTPLRLGSANFTAGGTTPGFNPCGANVAVRVTTWSAIKGLYAAPTQPGRP